MIKPLNDGAVDNAMYVWNAVEEGEVEEFGVIDSLGDLSGEGFPEDMAGISWAPWTAGKRSLISATVQRSLAMC